MNTEKILNAFNTLGEIADNLINLPESEKEAIAAVYRIQAVRSYLIDLARHLNDGKEPYDALLAAAIGDSKIDAP